MTQTLFDALCIKYGVAPDARGECWMDCPFCGHGDKHFSFSERGFKCFSCGEGSQALSRLNGGYVPYKVPFKPKPRGTRKRLPMQWQKNALHVLGQLRNKSNKAIAELWAQYRPFSVESVNVFELGYGLLPASKCHHERLIYPLFDGTPEPVAFRGRSIVCNCDKWLQSAGSRVGLWGREFLFEGATVVVAESPIGAMMAMQIEGAVCAVAGTGGAGVWRDEWTKQIAAYRPIQVVVWYDNDLAGQPADSVYSLLVSDWRAKHPGAKKLPRANGPWVANKLRDAGLNAVLYPWADDAPAKADLSWALLNYEERIGL